jgi:predicted enzyme related to lactoylglutathione lyase
MAKVTGIGGIFFRSQDPKALAAWYHRHLGINPTPTSAEDMPWMQEAGATVFAPFAKDTDYFGPETNQFMVNFRVDDIDGMIAGLEKAGLEITSREDMAGVGRFAHMFDPEGNKIELWEPAKH